MITHKFTAETWPHMAFPREQWAHSPDGRPSLFTRPLDLDSLRAEGNSQ